ncbi:MAG: hypothetical protein EBR01_06520 [Proteobacteria bacterium]|nr:hypothetical protein [Pseudomonadota bacterium]NBY21153.1 hypothetical protein [bacterium]
MKTLLFLFGILFSSMILANSPMRRADFEVYGYVVDVYNNTKDLAFQLNGKSIINLSDTNDCTLLINQKPQRCVWSSYLSSEGPSVYDVDFQWQDFVGLIRNEAQLQGAASTFFEVLEKYFSNSNSRVVNIIVGNGALSQYTKRVSRYFRPSSGGQFEVVLDLRARETHEIP